METGKANLALAALFTMAMLLPASLLSLTAVPAEEGTIFPPVIEEPALPTRAEIQTIQDIVVRIIADQGVEATHVHYRTPGTADYLQEDMTLTSGTLTDGYWEAAMDVGPEPGELELYLTATDGREAARSPTEGTFVIDVVCPCTPEILDASVPGTVQAGSALVVSARLVDADRGITLSVARYRSPGASEFTTKALRLAAGTERDGRWEAEIPAGSVEGTLELYLVATDGEIESRCPATGSYTVSVFRPQGPALEVFAPERVTYGGSPEVRARASDAAGIVGATVHFRLGGEPAYRQVEMTRQDGTANDGEWAATLPAADAVGEYLFFVVARNPSSDSRSEERSIRVLPDLYVSGLSVNGKDVLVKEEVVLSAVVGNRGDEPVTGLTVRFLDLSYSVGDVRSIRTVDDVTVPANGEVTVSVVWTPQADGERRVAVVLDPDQLVQEGDEANNELATTVPVGIESGMGNRFPIPPLGDIWPQLAIIAGAAAVVVGALLSGIAGKDRRRASFNGRGRNGKSGDRPGGE